MSVQEVFLLLLSNQKMEEIVHNIVIQEDNHVLAIFLSHIPYYRSADILDQLPDERRNKILTKIANIGEISRHEIERVKDMIVDKVNITVNDGEWKEYRQKTEQSSTPSKEMLRSIFTHMNYETRMKIQNELEKEGYKL